MTDLATRSDAEESADADKASTDGTAESATYAWAPPEKTRRTRNLSALWIGLPVGATVVALVAASLVLIAPGTAVAGVPVGGLTPGAAADAINARLASTTVAVDGPEGSFEVTGADLGASVDAVALTEAAFAENPMWNPASWFPGGIDAPVTIDPVRSAEVLRAAAPGLYVDPVDAQVVFDADSASYTVVPASEGEGIDVAAVHEALQGAFDAGLPTTTMSAAIVPISAPATTEEAEATAGTLNGILDAAGFYIGEERTVPVERAVTASWLSVSSSGGAFSFSADPALIQQAVDGLPEAVNREAVNATVITDSSGDVLFEEVKGVTGRALESTDGIAEGFAAQLAEGHAAYALPVTETEFATTSLARRIEVDLTAQRTYLYENDKVVRTFVISSGTADSPSDPGHFRIGWKTPMQDMGCAPGWPYCTKNVPWVAYYNGDEAFHGAYWHDNFGTPMSHGCINLRISEAKYLYDWAHPGTQVWVHH